MDALRELVRSLAAIIILTSFMEMVLPNSKMKNYLRLILGLFVIVIILNPVLVFLGSSGDFSAQAWIEPSQDGELEKILEDAQEMTARSQESALESYSAKVEQQVAAIVKLTPGVSQAEVEVELDRGSKGFSGKINQVTVTARLEQGKGEEQESIREEGSSFEAPGEIARRIQSIVADFYGLTVEQVTVKLEE